MTDRQETVRRIRAMKAIRHSTELEGSRSTDATRADQDAYAQGAITVDELGRRVRLRYHVR
nr:antitoxin VbhA family protein [Mycobacteroides abscessus]